MLVNPYLHPPQAIPGTRLLVTTLGIVGTRIPDPYNIRRSWEVQSVFSPLEGRALGGVRTKLVDQKGFVTFCNQRDLEVLLGIAAPDTFCSWAEVDYAGPEDSDWYGFCADEEDLVDDLFEREMFLRVQEPSGILTIGLELHRRVHLGKNMDVEESLFMRGDYNLETGACPDTDFNTLENRWTRIERNAIRWERSC